MSRSTRPRRRLRARDRLALLDAALPEDATLLFWLRRAAHRLGTRVSRLRRALLGKAVSVRALGRMLGNLRRLRGDG